MEMTSILLSINKPHVDNIRAGLKSEEMRKSAPSCRVPFRCYIYETRGRGGGAGLVVGEFICREEKVYPSNFLDLYDMANTKAICELIDRARLSYNELCRYANGGRLFGLRISDVRFYEKPKPLSRFSKVGFGHDVPLKRPPQAWGYVYELKVEN